MTRRRSLQEKKALAYRKERFPYAEYPDWFRRHWPRKKAQASRAFRHRVHQLLGDVSGAPAGQDDTATGERVGGVRRSIVRKWGTESLRERVDARHWRRIHTTGWNFFREAYTPERHRTRFIAVLTAMTQSTTPYARDVAIYFEHMLSGGNRAAADWQHPWTVAQRRQWLQAFLRDAPEWEARLQQWIARAKRVQKV